MKKINMKIGLIAVLALFVALSVGTALSADTQVLPTNNIQNFDLKNNTIQSGGWSYLYSTSRDDYTTAKALTKGNGRTFGSDMYVYSNNSTSRPRYVKSNGDMLSGSAPVIMCYTADQQDSLNNIRVSGKFKTSKDGKLVIARTFDTNSEKIEGNCEVVFEVMGSTEIDLILTLTYGNDILFCVSDMVSADKPANLNVSLSPTDNSLFRDFIGVCNTTNLAAIGSGKWSRSDFLWNEIEPRNGRFDQARINDYGKRILEAKKNGVTILPILSYTVNWAADSAAYSYEYGGYTYEIGAAKNTSSSSWQRSMVKKDSKGEITWSGIRDFDVTKIPFSKSRVRAWERYVEKMVSTYSQSPYNIEYFQIWNEAHPNSGFYYGGFERYFEDVHKTAADIIRKYGCRVVYGGWPVCGSVDEYIDVLTEYEAWDTIDVFDIHYFSLTDMDKLYKAAIKNGIEQPAVWQTEMGFTTDKKFVASNIPRMFYWSLIQDTATKDSFKQIYYDWWSPADPNAYGHGTTIYNGSKLSEHGLALKTLSTLFCSDKIEPFEFASQPPLKFNMSGQSAEGFVLDDKRLVIAVHVSDKRNTPEITFDFGDLKLSDVTRVDMLGGTDSVQIDGSKIIVKTEDSDKNVNKLNENNANFYISAAITQP